MEMPGSDQAERKNGSCNNSCLRPCKSHVVLSPLQLLLQAGVSADVTPGPTVQCHAG